MKKTALDWLLEQIYSDEYQRAFGKTYISIVITEQAKEMEKEQIIEAHKSASIESGFEYSANDWAEQYYNQNFKQ